MSKLTKLTTCPDCDSDFLPTKGYYNQLLKMYRSDLVVNATPLMDVVCFDCLARRIMRKDFEMRKD